MGQEAFDALADPTRREILQYLSVHEEATAGEIAGQFGNVGRTSVSSHLRVLRTASLIVERREGRFRHYALDAQGPVRDVLGFVQNLLESALKPLKEPAAERAANGVRTQRSAS